MQQGGLMALMKQRLGGQQGRAGFSPSPIAKQRFGGYSPPTPGQGGFTSGPGLQRQPMPQINRGSMGGYDGSGINPGASGMPQYRGMPGWRGPQLPGGVSPGDQGGFLARMAQMVANQRQAGAPQGGGGGWSPSQARGPMQGALGQFAAAQNALRQPSAPQRVAGAQSRFGAGTMPGRTPNALLRTSQAPSQYQGRRMNHAMSTPIGRPMFAKGGSIKKALKRLDRAKEMLQDSDPDFDHIASLVDKDIPEAKGLGDMIRKANTRKDWLAVEKRINNLQKELKK